MVSALPGEEDDLVAGTLGASEVKVIDGVTAVLGGEVTQEVVVGGRGVSRLFNLDRLEVVRDLVDNVLVALLQLQLLEGFKALRLDSDSGRLYKDIKRICNMMYVSRLLPVYISVLSLSLGPLPSGARRVIF